MALRLLVVVGALIAVAADSNICSTNATIGNAVIRAINLSWPGLEPARDAAASGDLGAACQHISDYYRNANTSAWFRSPTTPKPGSGLVGGNVDAMVFNDTFWGFPSPTHPCKIPRNADGGLQWTTWGPDNDDGEEAKGVMGGCTHFPLHMFGKQCVRALHIGKINK